jgi:hypothetical protein
MVMARTAGSTETQPGITRSSVAAVAEPAVAETVVEPASEIVTSAKDAVPSASAVAV